MSGEEPLEKRYMRPPQGKRRKWTFRMPTPKALIERPKPDLGPLRGGGEFKNTITTTLHHDMRTAAKMRDEIVGAVVALERRVISGDDDGARSASELEAVRAAHGVDSEEWRTTWEVVRDKYESRLYRGATADPVTGEEIFNPEEEARADAFIKPSTKVGKLTLSQAANKYLEQRHELARSTREEIGLRFRQLAAFMDDDALVVDVDAETALHFLRDYVANLKSARAPEGPTRVTLKKAQSVLTGAWDGLIGYSLIPNNNPWRAVKLPKGVGRPEKKKVRIFEVDEWKTLATYAPAGSALGDALRVAMMTGARLSDIVERRWEHVAPGAEWFNVAIGKTENATRRVPLMGMARTVVLARRPEEPEPNAMVFAELENRKDRDGGGRGLSNDFGRLLEKVLPEKVKTGIGFHSTRHTFRTIGRRAGVDDVTVRDIGGWSGGRNNQTDRRYDHGLDWPRYLEAMKSISAEYHRAGFLTAEEAGIEAPDLPE